MRLTIANVKGGAAKTTTAVYLALGLASRPRDAGGGRVLLVDADKYPSALDWSTTAGPDWPPNVVVVPWFVPDLRRRIEAVADDYDHVVVDTGPHDVTVIRQALYVSEEVIVPVAPTPLELRRLAPTFELAAEIDELSPITARVLLVRTRAGTSSRTEARAYLEEDLGVPTMAAEIGLREAYAMGCGTVPADLGEYVQVLDELLKPAPEVDDEQR